MKSEDSFPSVILSVSEGSSNLEGKDSSLTFRVTERGEEFFIGEVYVDR